MFRNLSLAILSSLVSISVFAQVDKKPGYQMKIEFKMDSPSRKFDSKGEVTVPTGAKGWVPLLPAMDGMSLLGKIIEVEDEVLTMEYMIVDSKQTPVEITNMSILSILGNESSISQKSDKAVVTVTNTTSEVE